MNIGRSVFFIGLVLATSPSGGLMAQQTNTLQGRIVEKLAAGRELRQDLAGVRGDGSSPLATCHGSQHQEQRTSTMKKQKIMSIGAHADDVEIHTGGTLAKFHDQGYEIVYVESTNNMSGGVSELHRMGRSRDGPKPRCP
jgi:hypothetical protein